MAQLDVQPKKTSLWWLWLLLGLVAIGIIYFLMKGSDKKSGEAMVTDPDSTAAQTTASTATGSAAPVASQPDWSGVDFNAPETTDQDITDKDISVRGSDRYRIYSLGENILFATGKDELQGSASQKLRQIAASLNRGYKGSNIAVYGNTDSTGDAGKNTMLGAQRAAAVKNWLVSSGGLDSTKVTVRSFGETKPVASNATASGRKQNRNVEIVALAGSGGQQ
jgi:outer membrane protein OmpA-like peptidoglycan-associated protein